MVPALAIQAYNEIAGHESREAEVREDALRLAQFASGELDRIIENGRAVLAALANLPAARDLDGLDCSDYVASLQKSFPQYASIGAIDLFGHPFCSSISIPAGSTAADREFFQNARDTGRFTVGHYLIGRIVKKPVLPMGLPFFDRSNHIAGVVYVSLDLDWLARYFAETRPFSQKTALVITDRDGTILARIPDNSSYAARVFGLNSAPNSMLKNPARPTLSRSMARCGLLVSYPPAHPPAAFTSASAWTRRTRSPGSMTRPGSVSC
jgi:hypothetical protein